MTLGDALRHKPDRGWFLQDDSEESLLVKAPEVGAKRFRFRNHRLMTGESLGEGMEAPVCVDIIHHYRPTRSKVWPCAIQFKSHVALAMQAIVNEKVNLPEMG